ncbi:MAG: hypothetical protein ABSD62_14810 [Candidatus Limnocylindrales bacterium]|jgi:hypothetical protein
MAEVLGLAQVTAELDRINELLDKLPAGPDGQISDEVIRPVRDRNVADLAADLKLTWPWFVPQLNSGLWWRRQLVQSEQRRAAEAGEAPSARVPGWPLESIGDRRVLAAGGGPWALVNMELAPRFVMKRGDSLESLERQWQEISARVEAAFRTSMFSYLIDEGPPGGAAKDDVAAYERYARWAARRLAGGESFRQIADAEYSARGAGTKASDTATADAPRERWREVKRGIRKALDILDSI